MYSGQSKAKVSMSILEISKIGRCKHFESRLLIVRPFHKEREEDEDQA